MESSAEARPRHSGYSIRLVSEFAVLTIDTPCSLSPVEFDELLPGLLEQLATLHAQAFRAGGATEGPRYLFGSTLLVPYTIDLMVSTAAVSPEKFAQDREQVADRLRQQYLKALSEPEEGGAA
jgi:hypothetical protein